MIGLNRVREERTKNDEMGRDKPRPRRNFTTPLRSDCFVCRRLYNNNFD